MTLDKEHINHTQQRWIDPSIRIQSHTRLSSHLLLKPRHISNVLAMTAIVCRHFLVVFCRRSFFFPFFPRLLLLLLLFRG